MGQKLAIGTVLTLLSMLGATAVFLNSYFARAEDLQRIEQQTVQSILGLRRQMIRQDLNAITIKEQFGEATLYDKALKEQLEREWKELVNTDGE